MNDIELIQVGHLWHTNKGDKNKEKWIQPDENAHLIKSVVIASSFGLFESKRGLDSVWATHCETGALQEAFHGHQLQPRVTPLPSDLIQGAGIGLQGVQGANGVLRHKEKQKTNKVYVYSWLRSRRKLNLEN